MLGIPFHSIFPGLTDVRVWSMYRMPNKMKKNRNFKVKRKNTMVGPSTIITISMFICKSKNTLVVEWNLS